MAFTKAEKREGATSMDMFFILVFGNEDGRSSSSPHFRIRAQCCGVVVYHCFVVFRVRRVRFCCTMIEFDTGDNSRGYRELSSKVFENSLGLRLLRPYSLNQHSSNDEADPGTALPLSPHQQRSCSEEGLVP
jgi:hypothetical protein